MDLVNPADGLVFCPEVHELGIVQPVEHIL